MTLKEIASEMTKVRNLSTIIEKKKDEFENEFVKKNTNWRESGWTVPFVDSRADKLESFIEKAIRESVEEALLEEKEEHCDGSHFQCTACLRRHTLSQMK